MDKKKSFITKFLDWWNSWTGTVVVVLFVIFFVAQSFMIPSSSMVSTLLIGDGLFGKKFSYGMPIPRIPYLEIPILPDWDGDGHLWASEGPKRGDIVIFRYPLNDKIHYVKRCVAKDGDLVMVRGKHLLIKPTEGNKWTKKHFKNIIDISGDLWAIDPYLDKHPGIHHDIRIQDNGRYPQEIFNFGPIKVPKGEYFMMGDNRDYSNDSRYWGSVAYKFVVGTPWFTHISIADDWTIRWNRMFRSIDDLEKEQIEKIKSQKLK